MRAGTSVFAKLLAIMLVMATSLMLLVGGFFGGVRGNVMDRIVGLELGADDYLPKPFEPRELVARIQAVLRRGTPIETEEVARAGALEVDWTARAARIDGADLALTTAEFELLALFVRNRGRVLTRERILDETWSS